MRRITIDNLPEAPLEAASVFHQRWLAEVSDLLERGEDVLIALAPADHTHREWRRAVAAGLARAYTPRRANLVAGTDEALAAMEAYLAAAPGITGHYLETDGEGAGDPVATPA